ncbi:Cysteine desulfurase [Pseudonocardia sp. Ae717_Ps2]|uniref:FAD-dependent oxidoreductase n=1 Tax=Pseudonocardia sp. Ae717_Ps2 TaxID=1885573 RepID=UPI00094B43A6|nr:FAD-dependent oxidoreductase [Pseudonocardia sp. Ae717_Ps2]OLM30083.1 Cysteine desulfurase [Pseudonocardia sp. Ae717_Ps2]
MTRTVLDADVVVAGLGVHGTAAAYELAARGRRVIGFDRFGEGHLRGSSHGRTRMIRRAYPNPVWNPLVERAYVGWRRWERRTGETLLHRTGGLYAHPEPGQLQGPGCETVSDPDRLRELAPGLSLPDGWHAVSDPDAGVLEAGAALRAARAAARTDGAELIFDEPVLGWTPVGSGPDAGVVVHTGRRSVRARRLVVATAGWVPDLVPELGGLFSTWRILTVTLRPGHPAAAPPSLPAFSVHRPQGLMFGLPDVAGSGYKAGTDTERIWDPERPVEPAAADEVAALCTLMSRHVPEVPAHPSTDVAEARACLYTMTTDRRFVIGRLPATPQVVVAAACSGHGFKFGPAVGEAAADLCEGIDRPDLDFVGVTRRLTAA